MADVIEGIQQEVKIGVVWSDEEMERIRAVNPHTKITIISWNDIESEVHPYAND